jgi:hypothetical protein
MATKKSTSKPAAAKKSTSSVGISILGGNKAEMRKWEIESAMNTLQRAAEIQKDSKLMGDVKKLAAQKVKEFNSIANGKLK